MFKIKCNTCKNVVYEKHLFKTDTMKCLDCGAHGFGVLNIETITSKTYLKETLQNVKVPFKGENNAT